MEADRARPRHRLGRRAARVHGRGSQQDQRGGGGSRPAQPRPCEDRASLPDRARRRRAGQGPKPARTTRPQADLGHARARRFAREVPSGTVSGRRDGGERWPRRELGRCARRASARLERPPLRARARLDGLPPARGAARSAVEPDARPRGDRPPLPRQPGAGLRNLAGAWPGAVSNAWRPTGSRVVPAY